MLRATYRSLCHSQTDREAFSLEYRSCIPSMNHFSRPDCHMNFTVRIVLATLVIMKPHMRLTHSCALR